MPPLKRISMGGYRAARELEFEPRSVCALVGEASSGKSTVLTGIWTLLEAAAPPPTIDDVSHGTAGRIHLEADVERGRTIFLDANPPATLNLNRAGAPPVLFFPANLRSRTLLAPVTGAGGDVAHLFEAPIPEHHWSAVDGGLQLVMGMERLLASNLRRFVLLVEEPELYLSPYAQRHLFRVLRSLAQHGNQILYSTHAPVFLSVDRMEELALVRHHPVRGTALFQPAALEESEAFRVLSEFDSDRAELFLARAALLVEGRTEKLTFPLVFEALGIEPDKEGIVVLECGGKGNIPLFARVCNACDIPYVVVHDRDAPKGDRPVESERVVNQQILEEAGRRRTVVLTPDFEAVSGVSARGRARKPRRAYRHYTDNGSVPEPLRVAVEKVVKAARHGK